MYVAALRSGSVLKRFSLELLERGDLDPAGKATMLDSRVVAVCRSNPNQNSEGWYTKCTRKIGKLSPPSTRTCKRQEYEARSQDPRISPQARNSEALRRSQPKPSPKTPTLQTLLSPNSLQQGRVHGIAEG